MADPHHLAQILPSSLASPGAAARVLVFHLASTAVHLAIYNGPRLRNRCRLALRQALDPGALASGFFSSVREPIDYAVYCSSTSSLLPQLWDAIAKQIGVAPVPLVHDSPHGLQIAYRDPAEFSTVRLAGALGARAVCPDRNVLIVDCGAATTFTALQRDGCIAGGTILHGLALWPAIAAKATGVGPIRARYRHRCLARSTGEALASGAYHGHVGALREITRRLTQEAFRKEPCHILATGNEASLFKGAQIFHAIEPRLVLLGLNEYARLLYGL